MALLHHSIGHDDPTMTTNTPAVSAPARSGASIFAILCAIGSFILSARGHAMWGLLAALLAIAGGMLGGVEAALKRAYVEAESNEPGSQIPDDPELATMTQARAIHEVVPVDYNVPGCPPDADTIFYVLAALAQGSKPKLKDELLHWH